MAGTFAFTAGVMTTARENFQMTKLADGRVVLTGGTSFGSTLGTGELYDPSTGNFTALPHTMLVPRSLHTATLLPNGNILIAGGIDATNANTGVIEEFNPLGGNFVFTGTMATARNSHAANRLASGNVLIAGGNAGTVGSAATTAAEVAVTAGTSAATGSLNSARMATFSAALPDGRVLVAGGTINGVPLASAEVYAPSDATSGTFSFTGDLATPRGGGSAAALNDGTVLVVGSSTNDQTAEIFYPSGPISATSPAFSEYPMPTGESNPQAIVSGPDGALWFTETNSSRIGQVTTGGSVTEFFLGLTSGSQPWGIASGPDGNLWFTESIGAGDGGDQVGQITTSGDIEEFGVASNFNVLLGIANGPDGNLYFVKNSGGANFLWRIGTDGTASSLTLSPAVCPSGCDPRQVTTGPDGNLWVTDGINDRVIRISPQGATSAFTVTASSRPEGIAAGPDGRIWFTMQDGNLIGVIDTTGANYTSYTIPTVGSQPQYIAAGPDGALWFTERNGNRIGRITTSGTITEYPIPTDSSQPFGIAAGPDGAIWFIELTTSKIGRLK